MIAGSGRSPEEEMATHPSILTLEIPWTKEPGGLQFMGSQRVGRDGSNLARIHAFVTYDKSIHTLHKNLLSVIEKRWNTVQ